MIGFKINLMGTKHPMCCELWTCHGRAGMHAISMLEPKKRKKKATPRTDEWGDGLQVGARRKRKWQGNRIVTTEQQSPRQSGLEVSFSPLNRTIKGNCPR